MYYAYMYIHMHVIAVIPQPELKSGPKLIIEQVFLEQEEMLIDQTWEEWGK